MRERSQAAVQVPGEVGGGKAAGLAHHRDRGLARGLPAPLEQRSEQRQGFGSWPGRTRRSAAVTDDSAGGGGEPGVRSDQTAAGAVGERRGPTGDGQGAEQIGVQDHRGGPRAVAGAPVEDAQGADQELVLLDGRLAFLGHQPVRGLQHGLTGGVGGVVVAQPASERVHRLHLDDDVQGAALGELQVDVGEGFQPGAELRRGAPNALGHSPDLAPPAAQHRDDAVRLAQLVRTQHHGFVAIRRHPAIVPYVPRLRRNDAAGPRLGRTEAAPPGRHASGARPPSVPRNKLPAHVAIVMDGNGRWAKARNRPRTDGHAAGEQALFDTIEGAIEVGIRYLSAYAFSTENWTRSPDEVRWLMGFNRDVIHRRRDEFARMGVRVRWAGRRPRLWRSVIRELEEAEAMTVDNDVITLQFCVNYGGRAEIVDATRRIAEMAAAGKLDPAKLTEARFRQFLDEPDIPDVDLFIRSSGEQRTSNFLLWQSAYAEMIFMDRLWPDFDRRDLWRAVELYAERDRRFGSAHG